MKRLSDLALFSFSEFSPLPKRSRRDSHCDGGGNARRQTVETTGIGDYTGHFMTRPAAPQTNQDSVDFCCGIQSLIFRNTSLPF